ncbi:MAG TPA: hypothetical protein VF212_11440 [Longimicrobiales bacterium]
MAQMVLTDCYISINDVVVSGQGTNVAISYSAEAIEVTPFGSATRQHIGGTKDWSMSFEFNADEAVTGDFFDLVGTTVPVEVRPTSGERSPTNPGYCGMALVTEYAPIDGGVGEAHTVSLTVVSAGDLIRDTAPASV